MSKNSKERKNIMSLPDTPRTRALAHLIARITRRQFRTKQRRLNWQFQKGSISEEEWDRQYQEIQQRLNSLPSLPEEK
jgi:hypothetical protein